MPRGWFIDWSVLGVLGLLAIAFVFLPTEKIDPYIDDGRPRITGWAAWQDDGRAPMERKSGLRIAIEGRLKWLGVDVSGPASSPGSSSGTAARGST